MLLTLGLAS